MAAAPPASSCQWNCSPSSRPPTEVPRATPARYGIHRGDRQPGRLDRLAGRAQGQPGGPVRPPAVPARRARAFAHLAGVVAAQLGHVEPLGQADPARAVLHGLPDLLGVLPERTTDRHCGDHDPFSAHPDLLDSVPSTVRRPALIPARCRSSSRTRNGAETVWILAVPELEGQPRRGDLRVRPGRCRPPGRAWASTRRGPPGRPSPCRPRPCAPGAGTVSTPSSPAQHTGSSAKPSLQPAISASRPTNSWFDVDHPLQTELERREGLGALALQVDEPRLHPADVDRRRPAGPGAERDQLGPQRRRLAGRHVDLVAVLPGDPGPADQQARRRRARQ